jgi:hypothetical protein
VLGPPWPSALPKGSTCPSARRKRNARGQALLMIPGGSGEAKMYCEGSGTFDDAGGLGETERCHLRHTIMPEASP